MGKHYNRRKPKPIMKEETTNDIFRNKSTLTATKLPNDWQQKANKIANSRHAANLTLSVASFCIGQFITSNYVLSIIFSVILFIILEVFKER